MCRIDSHNWLSAKMKILHVEEQAFSFPQFFIDLQKNSFVNSFYRHNPGANFGWLPELDHRAMVGPTLGNKIWSP